MCRYFQDIASLTFRLGTRCCVMFRLHYFLNTASLSVKLIFLVGHYHDRAVSHPQLDSSKSGRSTYICVVISVTSSQHLALFTSLPCPPPSYSYHPFIFIT